MIVFKKLSIAAYICCSISLPVLAVDISSNNGLYINNDPNKDSATIAIGDNPNTRRMNGLNSISIGKSSSIYSGDNGIAIGTSSYVSGKDAISIGGEAKALNKGTIVIGKNAKSNGSGVVIGEGASQGGWRKYYPGESTASVANTVVIGNGSQAPNVASVAVGSNSTSSAGGFSTAIGSSANSYGKSSTALGANSTAQSWGSVSLGIDSLSDREDSLSGYMPESKNLNAETVVQSRFNDVQKNQFINMDANITELQKIVMPLYEDYYSAKNAYDKKLLELNDSKLSATSPEFIAKKKELELEYSDVVKKSQAYNNAKETGELIKLLDARSSLFSTYIATHGAVSVGRTAKNDIPAVTRQITNVAAGSYDTDVVNVAQLKDLQKLTEKTDSKLDNKINENTKNIKINRQKIEEEKYERVNGDREAIRVSTNYTDKKTNSFEQRINSNVNKRFAQLKDDIDKNKKRSDAGIAGAMAMTGIPAVPNKTVSFGMAMAGYRSEGAIAAGFHINTSENSAVKVNTAWDSQSGLGVSAGMALGW